MKVKLMRLIYEEGGVLVWIGRDPIDATLVLIVLEINGHRHFMAIPIVELATLLGIRTFKCDN